MVCEPVITRQMDGGDEVLLIEEPPRTLSELFVAILFALPFAAAGLLFIYAAFFVCRGPVYGASEKPITGWQAVAFLWGVRTVILGFVGFVFTAVSSIFTRDKFTLNAYAGTIEARLLLGRKVLWTSRHLVRKFTNIIVSIVTFRGGRHRFTVVLRQRRGALVLGGFTRLEDAELMAEQIADFTGLPFTNKTERLP